MGDVLVSDDPPLLRQPLEDGLGHIRPTDERHELRNREQHGAVGVAVPQQGVHLEHRVVRPVGVAHEAVVDDPLEHGGRPDPHGSFVPDRRSRRRARLERVTERTDEEQLAVYARELVDAVDEAIATWVERCVASTLAAAGVTLDDETARAARAAGQRCRVEVVAELRLLLDADIDAQTSTPLQVLRAAVRFPTAVLVDAGVDDVDRDDFDRRAFPADRYGLTPSGFVDVDPALADPGLRWGAAKAHVHLARRR